MPVAQNRIIFENDVAEIGHGGPAAWLDDVDLHHDLRDARRVLRIELHRLQASTERTAPPSAWDCPWPEAASEPTTTQAPAPRRHIRTLAWLILCCGAMLLAGGGMLLALSHVAPRPDLWDPGLLSALCGQFLIVLGLVLPRGQAASVRSMRTEPQSSESQLTQVLPWRIPLGEAVHTARSA